ncbi:hypothetical protein [Variovorax sp.]|jgi:hypothetical protein|uniref:hypothetical protein n=1 Tax=Variovorax sp. TaxID=1871043 RepID=UPI004037E19B
MNSDFMVDLGYLYDDLAASLLALGIALEKSGGLKPELLQEAAQERLLTLTVGKTEPPPYVLLRMLATKMPLNSDG